MMALAKSKPVLLLSPTNEENSIGFTTLQSLFMTP